MQSLTPEVKICLVFELSESKVHRHQKTLKFVGQAFDHLSSYNHVLVQADSLTIHNTIM